MKQDYIEWLYPGIIVSDTSTEKVNDRAIPKKFPKGAVAFRFFERTEITEGKETLHGKPKGHSHWYYVEGEKLSLEQVKEKHPGEKVLISNMEINDCENIVWTKSGRAFPLEKNDIIL